MTIYAAVCDRVVEALVAAPDPNDGRHVFIDVTAVSPMPQVGWTMQDDRHFAPPANAPTIYRKLSRNEMRRHLFANAPSMTPAAWASLFDAAADANVKLYAQAYGMATDISCPLDQTDAAGAGETEQGLAILVGESKITAAEKQAVIDSWPRV